MGNICLSGIPKEDIAQLGIADFSRFPPWLMLWPAFWMDVLCLPIGCRDSWRQYVPYGLAEPGQWFSEEFETARVMRSLPDRLSFEQFQALKGYTVRTGSGMLAGVNSWADMNDWSKSLYEYMFDTPSTSLAKLTTPTAFGVILLLVCLIKIIKAVAMPQFRAIGRYLALRAHGETWVKENEERIVKFGEYVFRLCYHSFISLVGFKLFWNAPWWDESQGGTINLYSDFPHDPVQPSMCWYYLFQAAYNVDAMISLLEISFAIKVLPKDSAVPMKVVWASTVRGDFNEMMAHHIVTNALVFTSSHLVQTRIGSMVFWMHDISDVPVDLAKLANFVKWKAGTIGFFFLLCAVWAYTRLYILPFYIWASIYNKSQWLAKDLLEFWIYFYAYQPMFLVLLGVLIFLHFVWFSMFIKMGVLLVTKGETHDLSEHKKGEKDNSIQNGHATNGHKQKVY